MKCTLQSQISPGLEVELAIEKLKKKLKAPGVDHIPSAITQAGGGRLYKEIHKLIVLIWNT